MKHFLLGLVMPLVTSFGADKDFLADTPADFHGYVEVTCINDPVKAESVQLCARGKMEDMAAPGFNNRFRVLLYGNSSKDLYLPPTADFVKVEATKEGFIVITAVLWGTLRIEPYSQEIRREMARNANKFEVRPQNIRVQRIDDHTTEILITETTEDYRANGLPTYTWRQKHEASLVTLSHAH